MMTDWNKTEQGVMINMACQAKADIWKRVYTKYYMTRLYNGEKIFADDICNSKMEQMLEYISRPKHFFWITVNPKPEITYSNFSAKVEKSVSKRWVKQSKYVYEVRSHDGEKYMGMHCHMIIETIRTKRMSEVKREFYNTFKSLVGNNKHVDVKQFPYSYYNDKVDYLHGKKDDPEKEHAIYYTNLWRSENNIPEIVEHSIQGEAM